MTADPIIVDTPGTAFVCTPCKNGDHDDCANHSLWNGMDISEAPPDDLICQCGDGPCAPQMSYACAQWLHNCGGCSCDCHDDPKARAIWREAWLRWDARNQDLTDD